MTIKKIKDSASILDVMREFEGEALKKCGNLTWTMPCPLHGGRSLGHFKVNERDNYAHCFSCGETVDAVDYLKRVHGMKFTEAMQYLGAKYGIPVEGSEKYHPKPAKPYIAPPPLPIAYMQNSFIHESKANIGKDVLLTWLRSLNWNDEQRARLELMITLYAIGTYIDERWGTIYTMFWYINHLGKICTAKLMRYKPDGHRNKDKYSTDWLHSRLSIQRGGKFDEEKWAIDKVVYFGNHLTQAYPNATINIVESEKTALICSIYLGNISQWLWIACGGKSNLTREKMLPLIEQGRTIILYPDKDGVEEWKKMAKDIKYDKLHVNEKFMRDNWRPEDGPKADIADVLIRLMTPSKSDLDTISEIFPETIGMMIDKLNLEIEK